MGAAIGQILPFAIGVALSPIPIIAVVLMLGTPRARGNGLAFIAGWLVGLVVVGAIVLLASSGANASESDGPAAWVGVVEVLLGVALLRIALRQWHARPADGDEPAMPGWMRTIDTFTPARSFGIAAVLSGVNPKNLLLTAAACQSIAQTGISGSDQAITLAVFVVIATLGPGIPVAIYFLMGDRATAILAELKEWMARNNAAIMAVLCLIIGAKVIGDGISALSG